MKISEIFGNTCQGELDVGQPSIFIRLSGCNLIEMKKGCKWCDSLYAEENFRLMTVDEIMNEVKKYNCYNVVVTGGEPLAQGDKLFPLLMELNDEGYNISLETNGTLYDHRIFTMVDKINCSPKRQCYDLNILKKIVKLKNARFKFVFEKGKSKWWENIVKELGIDNSRVWIMPEGKTRKEQLENMKEVWEYCVKMNYNFTLRTHIIIFNDKRGK